MRLLNIGKAGVLAAALVAPFIGGCNKKETVTVAPGGRALAFDFNPDSTDDKNLKHDFNIVFKDHITEDELKEKLKPLGEIAYRGFNYETPARKKTRYYQVEIYTNSSLEEAKEFIQTLEDVEVSENTGTWKKFGSVSFE